MYKLEKDKTQQHKYLIIERIAFEDAQFQLEITDIQYVNLSCRVIASDALPQFDCKNDLENNYKLDENTVV